MSATETYLRSLEASTDATPLASGKPWVVRLDGRAFHSFTRGAVKPQDPRMTKAMVATTRDLVEEFHADLGYTQSDEITLTFKAHPETIFGGRIFKINSLMAAYASVRFNHHIQQSQFSESESDLRKRWTSSRATFDCRVLRCETEDDVGLALESRVDDAYNNGILSLAQTICTNTEINNAPLRELEEKTRVEASRADPHLVYGTVVKRVTVLVPAVDKRTGLAVGDGFAKRNRLQEFPGCEL